MFSRFIVLSCMFVFIFSCENTPEADTNTSLMNVNVSNIIVRDANGQNLGWATGTISAQVSIINTLGYRYAVEELSGALVVSSFGFDATNCSGNRYRSNDYSKAVFFDGTSFFKFANTTVIAIQVMASQRFSSGCVNGSVTGTKVVLLTSTTRAEVGIPDTITGPITFTFP